MKCQQSQITQAVFDLCTGIELRSVEQSVRDLVPHKRLLNRTRNIICPVENGDIRKFDSELLMQAQDFSCDPPAFLLCRARMVVQHPERRIPDRKKLLLYPVDIVPDQRIADGKNRRTGPIVPIQQNRPDIRESLVKSVDVIDIRTAPGINGLIGIPHDKEISVFAGKQTRQFIIAGTHILKLIDLQILNPVLPFRQHVRNCMKQVEDKVNQVVKIQRIELALFCQIVCKDRGNPVRGILGRNSARELRLRHLPDIFTAAFPCGNLMQDFRIREIPGRQSHFLIDFAEKRFLILGVQNQETGRIAKPVDVLPEYGHTETVEGIDQCGGVFSEQIPDPAAHFTCRLIGKGHGENVFRQNSERSHKIHQAIGQNPGLSRTGAGDNPHISFGCPHSLLLSIVQLFHPGKRIHENLLLLSGYCTVGAEIFNRGSKNSAGDFQ